MRCSVQLELNHCFLASHQSHLDDKLLCMEKSSELDVEFRKENKNTQKVQCSVCVNVEREDESRFTNVSPPRTAECFPRNHVRSIIQPDGQVDGKIFSRVRATL